MTEGIYQGIGARVAALLLGVALGLPAQGSPPKPAAAGAGTAEAGTAEAGTAGGPTHAELLGVWAGSKTFGPEVHGTLTVHRRGESWTGELAGFRFPLHHQGEALTFRLPGERGEFHGRLETGNGVLYGQWVQPGVVGGFGQRFSTPVRLDPVAADLWQGTVTPMPDRIQVYLVLESKHGGELRAFLRNPQSNFGRILDLRELRRRGEAVELWGTLAWEQEAAPRALVLGSLRSAPEVLTIFLEGMGGSYDLERLHEEEPSHFFPRPWARGDYGYHPPLPRPDGWEIASLEEVAMAAEPMEALVRKMLTTPMDAIDAPYIQAVLVARRGKLVFEEYFHGTTAEHAHDVRSASKSLTAALAGAAVHQGKVTLDAKVYEVMSGGALPEGLDPRAAGMTLEHLLTMTSGLACDDWDGASPGGEDRIQSQDEEPDWHRYLLRLPMIYPPGKHPAYCSVGMSLAGEVIARSAGESFPESFDRYLARPLGMGTYHTNLMPNGKAYAGGGLRIRARDFLKFGQLMLDDGRWRGRRILPPGWAAEATRKRFVLGTRRPEGYGYGWWSFRYQHRGREWEAFYAGGNGGNYIIAVPELDLAVAFLASNYSQGIQHETKYRYVPEFILEAVVRGEAPLGDPDAAIPEPAAPKGSVGP